MTLVILLFSRGQESVIKALKMRQQDSIADNPELPNFNEVRHLPLPMLSFVGNFR